MPSDHPQTPQSPSQTSFVVADLPGKTTASPQITHSLPTPAHSINGSMSSLIDAGMEVSHDEQSNKRKRDVEDHGDRDLKKVHIEEGRLSIEDLHLDVGAKYLLCKTPHKPAPVPFKDDLFLRYGLDSIAASVARTKPDGSKGVKLRKTYKNQIKEYGLSGAFEPDKKELSSPDTLGALMAFPQDVWDSQYVREQETGMGLPASSLEMLGRALAMEPGRLPNGRWDEKVLGLQEKNPAPPAQVLKAAHNGNRTPLQNPLVARTSKSELPRPKRNVKKRTYGDSSFEGYGEGYVDDDAQDVGYSTGDADERGGSRKRPKKNPQTHGFQNGPMRQNSYGPGMVGA